MIAGVDGCRAGWIVALTARWPAGEPPHLLLCRDFQALLTVTAECSATMIDMPIGLPASSNPRLCDELARQKLSATSNRLFLAPPRSTLRAATAEEFQQLHREATGHGTGLPVWGLVEKLRQVDQAMTPSLQDRVMEFHPELAWQHLNGGTPLISKHQTEGLAQRQALLEPHVPGVDQLTAWKQRLGRAAGLDDLLDALVGLATAQAFVDGPDTSPLPEQRRIAAILNEQMAAVEQARAACEAQLNAINHLPAALLRRAANHVSARALASAQPACEHPTQVKNPDSHESRGCFGADASA